MLRAQLPAAHPHKCPSTPSPPPCTAAACRAAPVRRPRGHLRRRQDVLPVRRRRREDGGTGCAARRARGACSTGAAAPAGVAAAARCGVPGCHARACNGHSFEFSPTHSMLVPLRARQAPSWRQRRRLQRCLQWGLWTTQATLAGPWITPATLGPRCRARRAAPLQPPAPRRPHLPCQLPRTRPHVVLLRPALLLRHQWRQRQLPQPPARPPLLLPPCGLRPLRWPPA